LNRSVAAIRFREVSKSFGRRRAGVQALCDISLEVRASGITGLLGPNGAGKSTLMLTALGLVRPDAGSCEIFGRPAAEPSARSGVGFLPEDVDYEAGFTVGEVLRLHSRLTVGARGSSLHQWLERFDLRLPLSRRIAGCSHGTVRRLALACALLGAPRLLVLDEPTSGLDVASRQLLLNELARFRERGGTVLVSSHVLSELEQICDALAILDQGKLVHHGTLRPGDTSRIQVKVSGLSRPRLEQILGSGWRIRTEQGILIAASPPDCRRPGGVASAIEQAGGTVVDLRLGRPLSEIYRRRIGT
jgi:ABC-type multidrug transport system ATPase subunit